MALNNRFTTKSIMWIYSFCQCSAVAAHLADGYEWARASGLGKKCERTCKLYVLSHTRISPSNHIYVFVFRRYHMFRTYWIEMLSYSEKQRYALNIIQVPRAIISWFVLYLLVFDVHRVASLPKNVIDWNEIADLYRIISWYILIKH